MYMYCGMADIAAETGDRALVTAQRMLALDVNGEYGDVMERALYNNVISGVSLDGKHFFYANPLVSHPHPRRSGATLRPGWYGCACCPPNLARLLTSLGAYVYGQARNTNFFLLYVNSEADFDVAGVRVHLNRESAYPWSETIRMLDSTDAQMRFALALRVRRASGKPVRLAALTRKGYAYIKREWSQNGEVMLSFSMPAERVYSDPRVREK